MESLTELLLLLKEGAVQRMSFGVIKKLEAVEDLNRAAPLDAYNTTVNPRCGRRSGRVGRIGWIGAITQGARGWGRAGQGWRICLRFNPGVVIGNVHNHKRVQLECQSAARRRHNRLQQGTSDRGLKIEDLLDLDFKIKEKGTHGILG